jgi:hypothetical protein
MTRVRAEQLEKRRSTPDRRENILFPLRPKRLWGPLSFLSSGYWMPFPARKNGQRVELTNYLHLPSRFRLHRTVLHRRRDTITHLNYFLLYIYLCFFTFFLSVFTFFHRFLYFSFLSSLPFYFNLSTFISCYFIYHPYPIPPHFSIFPFWFRIYSYIHIIFLFSLRIYYLFIKYRATPEVCVSALRYLPFA